MQRRRLPSQGERLETLSVIADHLIGHETYVSWWSPAPLGVLPRPDLRHKTAVLVGQDEGRLIFRLSGGGNLTVQKRCVLGLMLDER